jgi:predicted enzyme related to lactoylglutathione lyase
MATKTKAKSKNVKTRNTTGSIVWFEIPADNPERAKKFYGSLFGWKVKLFPGMTEYWHIDTGGGDDTPDGGMITRKHPGQPITNYISVKSVTASMAKVEKIGGKVCMPKTAVPQKGYFAICQDTENNTFALWETNAGAK